MTILTTISEISYAGITGQDTFAYPFRVDLKTDMNITLDSVAVAQGDFSITGLGDAGGGEITLNTPLVANTAVVLFRDVEPTQEIDYQPFDAFPSKTHEGALDKLTMLVQEAESSVARALKFPPGDLTDTALPDIPTRINKFLAFGSSGELAAASGTGAGVNEVTATAPITSTGGLAPNIRYPASEIAELGKVQADRVVTADANGNVDFDKNFILSGSPVSSINITGLIFPVDKMIEMNFFVRGIPTLSPSTLQIMINNEPPASSFYNISRRVEDGVITSFEDGLSLTSTWSSSNRFMGTITLFQNSVDGFIDFAFTLKQRTDASINIMEGYGEFTGTDIITSLGLQNSGGTNAFDVGSQLTLKMI